MSYIKTNWVNDQTELSAENMNHIENGIENAYAQPLIAVSDTAPLTYEGGDRYFNTTNNIMYVASSSLGWLIDIENPVQEGVFYVVLEEQKSYTYDGTTLISVGGGTGGIVVYPDTPDEDTQLYIEEDDLDFQGLPISNETTTGSDITYSADYINNLNTYSTTEQRIGTWVNGKPLYRKTFSCGALPNATTKSVEVDLDFVNKTILVKKMYGYAYRPTGTYVMYPLPNTSSTNPVSIYCSVSNNKSVIQIVTSTDRSDYTDSYITLEYTKTTD